MYLDKNRIKWYFEWKNMLMDKDKPLTKEMKQAGYESMNPLYNAIYSEINNNNNISVNATIPDAICMHCGKLPTDHNGYGMIATCCGAFFCSECLNEASTQQIISPDDNFAIQSPDYYCVCCRRKNPRYQFNAARKKDSAIQCTNLIDDNYSKKEFLEGRSEELVFDYFFYGFMCGWSPLKHLGRGLNIKNDIDQGTIDRNLFKQGVVPVLDSILPKDQLAILAVKNINDVLTKLKIIPKRGSLILYYGCPQHMQERVVKYQGIIRESKEGGLIINSGKTQKHIQPIYNCNIMFKSDVGSLIGLHENIIAIVAWETPVQGDERNQLFGRLLRLNSWGNPLTFYISTNVSE